MGIFEKPKAPAKTAEQVATEVRTRSLLDKEIEEEEDRFKVLASGRLGRKALLSGAPRSAREAASGATRGGGGGASSLLSAPRTTPTRTPRGSTNQPRRVPN